MSIVSGMGPWDATVSVVTASGHLELGTFGTFQFASGALQSGYGVSTAYAPIPVTCHSCGKELSNAMTGIARYYTPLFVFSTCLDCAGYDPKLGRVTTRYDWIKDSVPLDPEIPDGILADWLEDHGRESDATYIRERP